jgi:hypothetical protein
MTDLNRAIEPGDDDATHAGHLLDDLLYRALELRGAYGLSLAARLRDAEQRYLEQHNEFDLEANG